LIGQPLVAIPEQDVSQISQNQLNRWQMLRQCHQHFWNQWSREYLSTLQQRSKWNPCEPNVAVGDVVVIKTPHVPPTVWKIGRVLKIHPGADGVVSVVILRTTSGEIRRPVVQLVKLPTEA